MAEENQQVKDNEAALKDLQSAQEEALSDRQSAVDEAIKNQQVEQGNHIDTEKEQREAALKALEDEDGGADGEAKVDSTGVKTNPEASSTEDPRNTPEGERARKGNAAQAKKAEEKGQARESDENKDK